MTIHAKKVIIISIILKKLKRITIMSDYERYGDYDDIEEDLPKSKNPVVITLKIMIAVVCIGVIGLIAFRMIAFNSYPASVSNVYFNEKLTAYYNERGGDVEIKTQKLRAPYDDEDEGNFFCKHLYVIEEIDQLQITLRYNTATIEKMANEFGIELDENSDDLFTYRLVGSYSADCDVNGEMIVDDGNAYWVVGELTATEYDKKLTYRYKKLVFDNVDISLDEIGTPYWIRLEIRVKGADGDKVYMVPIFENNDKLSTFKDYKLSAKEKP